MTNNQTLSIWKMNLKFIWRKFLKFISIIKWTGVKNLSQSPIKYFTFTLSVMPILIGVLSLSADRLVFLERELPQFFDVLDPFLKTVRLFIADKTGRILIIYFGVLAFSIGTVLYGWFAPEWIRKFKDKDEAVDYYLALAKNAASVKATRIEESYIYEATKVFKKYPEVDSINLGKRAVCSTLFLSSIFFLLLGSLQNFYEMVSITLADL